MWGAIIGDLAGSIYEYDQYKNCHPLVINKLINDNSFFSDDTILTVAILDAILTKDSYENKLKEYALKYKDITPKTNSYFSTMFSPVFTKWYNSNYEGKSNGNGAMMRISPVGFLYNTKNEVKENVKKATIPSHNSKSALLCADIVAMIIFLSRKGYNKNQIVSSLNLKFNYIPFKKFNTSCDETIGNCLYALFSSNDFESSIKKVISYGGDTDTNACIVGSMAEALYGINKRIIRDAKKFIPPEINNTIEKGYEKILILK